MPYRIASLISLAGLLGLGPFVPGLLSAQDRTDAEAIRSAIRAAPESVSRDARIVDWQMNELRSGSNGWTCLPDRPDSPGTDPWCVDGPWLEFLHAFMNGREPAFENLGFAYMLMGDTPVSNSDPFAEGPTGADDWVEDPGAHLMMLVPDRSLLESLPTDHRNGGPWVMWPETPYVHVMIPVDPGF